MPIPRRTNNKATRAVSSYQDVLQGYSNPKRKQMPITLQQWIIIKVLIQPGHAKGWQWLLTQSLQRSIQFNIIP
eukprot:7209560-Ditylum_brightwellii.AAC.1